MSSTGKNDTLSMPVLFGVFVAFLLLGVLMCTWPTITLMDMLEAINHRADLIAFDKGAYYLFGGGLFFIILSVGAAISFKVKNISPKKYASVYGTLLLISLALVFIIPHVVHLMVDESMTSKGYSLCEVKSTQWLHAKTIVYTKSLPCD